jgi:hypothetical protein
MSGLMTVLNVCLIVLRLAAEPERRESPLLSALWLKNIPVGDRTRKQGKWATHRPTRY